MACFADEMSERIVERVRRGGEASVEGQLAGTLVLWFIAVAIGAAVSAKVVIIFVCGTGEIGGDGLRGLHLLDDWGWFSWSVQARSDERWDFASDVEGRGVGCAKALMLWFIAVAIVDIAVVAGI
jgi:hypothetical protein